MKKPTLVAAAAVLMFTSSIYADNHGNVRVATAIEQGDPFEGEKSSHTYWWMQDKQSVRTGTTDIKFPNGKIYKFDSVRKKF